MSGPGLALLPLWFQDLQKSHTTFSPKTGFAHLCFCAEF